MKTLHVRNVPEELYRRLKTLAASSNRSLSAQVIELLTQAVEDEERRERQNAVLDSIRRRRYIPADNVPPSLELLQEDRKR